MAETPKAWSILLMLQSRLQEILIANDFRTNAGLDVRTEVTSEELNAPRITLYSGSVVRPEDSRSPNERELVVVIEASVPVSLDDAQQQIVAIAEDIEDVLEGLLLAPIALPPEFQEALYLDRPDGMPAMTAQLMFSTRFRR